jgi:gluconate 2-dehydrogenase gamma chain
MILCFLVQVWVAPATFTIYACTEGVGQKQEQNMAGQGVERRDAIRMIALASMAGAFPGFRRWAFACGHENSRNQSADRPTDPYQPQFFTAEEFRMVDHLAEMIIPANRSPGAHDAGVAEFIDFMVFNGADLSSAGLGGLENRFRSGLKWMNAHSRQLYGRSFLECSEQQQTELLECLAYKNKFRRGEEEGRAFFQLMRDYTVKGYYTSRIGLEELEYPGLKTMWAEMPGCPHKDDPEHLHLPPPVY